MLSKVSFNVLDDFYSWPSRFQGMSVLLWAPTHPSQGARGAERVATAIRLESTLDRHTDAEAVRLLSLAGNGEQVPSSWERVKDYVRHDIQMLELVFGTFYFSNMCVAILNALQQPQLVQAYSSFHWAMTIWEYHIA
jgi:hypothetical protein